MFFYESFSIALVYMSQTYAEEMAMHPDVSYTPYATFPMEQTVYIITFTKFEQGNLLSETNDDAKSGDESNDDSTMPSPISK